MERDIHIIRHLLSVLIAVMGCYLMSVLSSLLVPLALALFLAILLQPALAWFEARDYRFSVSLGIIFAASALVMGGCGAIVYSTATSLLDAKDELLTRLNEKISGFSGMINSLSDQRVEPGQAVEGLGHLLVGWLQSSSGALASLLGDFTNIVFMTLLYLLAFVGGILRYEHYLGYLRDGVGEGGSDPVEQNRLLDGFEEVKQSIVTYMKIKVIVSSVTGGLTWLLCLIFGLKFALFWGFLAFILNFIPTIGSLIAMAPPILLSFVLLESWAAIVTFALLLIIAQNVIGNVVEPRMMGSSLSLNTATVILGLVFWGKIWGITGMVLSVPMLVLTKVILAQIPDAAMLVRLMGEDAGVKSEPPDKKSPAAAAT